MKKLLYRVLLILAALTFTYLVRTTPQDTTFLNHARNIVKHPKKAPVAVPTGTWEVVDDIKEEGDEEKEEDLDEKREDDKDEKREDDL